MLQLPTRIGATCLVAATLTVAGASARAESGKPSKVAAPTAETWGALVRCAAQAMPYPWSTSGDGHVGDDLVVIGGDPLYVFTPRYGGATSRSVYCGAGAATAGHCNVRIPYQPPTADSRDRGHLYMRLPKEGFITQAFVPGKPLATVKELEEATRAIRGVRILTSESGKPTPFWPLLDAKQLWPKTGAPKVADGVASVLVDATLVHLRREAKDRFRQRPSSERLAALESCARAGELNALKPLLDLASSERDKLQKHIARQRELATKLSVQVTPVAKPLARCGKLILEAKVTNEGTEPFDYEEMSCSWQDGWKLTSDAVYISRESMCASNSPVRKTLAPGATVDRRLPIRANKSAPKGTVKLQLRWGDDPPIESEAVALVIKGDECGAKP